jgi:branched-chain amino acid transport system substrate-binding protein
MWHQIPTNKKIAELSPNDADGNAIRHALFPDLTKAGFTVVDSGPYEDGTTDYSSQIAKFKSEGCELFNTFPIPPDFATFWRQAAQQGLTKTLKIATVAKTGLFPSSVEALGSLGDKLTTAAYWHPAFPYKSSLTGISSRALGDDYEKTTGKQWTQQLGASMSLLDAGITALVNSGNPKSKAAIAKAISVLKTTTTVGKVDFTSGPVPNVATTVLIGSQWIKNPAGSKFAYNLELVEHVEDPQVPITAKIRPYNS